jgi:hypothetical protein
MPLFENSRRETTVIVTLYETLADVLARLRTHANGTVLLDIPDGSPLFLTSGEFRSLREVAQQRRIALTIVSDDPLRDQLASVFNLAIVGRDVTAVPRTEPPPLQQTPRSPGPVPRWDREGLPPLPDEDDRPRRSDRGRAEPAPPRREPTERERGIWPKGRPSATPGPVPNRSLPPTDEAAFDPGPSTRDATTRRPPIAAPRGADGNPVRWPDDAPASRPTGRPGHDEGPILATPETTRRRDARTDPHLADDASEVPRRAVTVPVAMTRTRRVSGRGLLAIIGAAIAAILVLTLLLGIFVFSSARVTLALESARLTGTVDCEIVPPGESGTATVVIQGAQKDIDVSYTGSVPTTGSRAVPDGVASGRVRFSNPTDQTVSITAGTELAAPGGQSFRVSSDVTVAAGNAALSQFGSGEAVVEATAAGAAGNLGAGELSGLLDNGVYYSNRDAALSGGTDKQIKTVQPADLQTLHDTATEQLRQMAASGQVGGLDADTLVVPATVTLSTPKFTDDLQAGDDGETISTSATATATVLTYSNHELRLRATEALIPVLSSQLTPDLQLSESTVQLTAQGETGEQSGQGATFQVSGVANTTASLSDAEARTLADQLAGKSASDVNSILTANQRVSSYDVSYSPDWLPDRMPNSADRIDITVRQ